MNSIHVDLLGTETRYYRTARYTTRVLEGGAGVPLILMHGGGGHAETYSRNLTRLATLCRPMAIDFIWHGLSSKPAYISGNWLAQFTDQVLDLMDHLGIERAHVEGESLGGWICMDMAINHPDRVDRVILNTAWGMKLKGSEADASKADFASLRETSLNALHNPTPELIRRRLEWLMPLGGVTDELVHLRRALWSRPDTRSALTEYYERLFSPECESLLFDEHDLARITAPTLLLWTEKNPIAGPEVAARMQSIIAGSQLHVIKGAAHWPQWECPDEHDRVVMSFLGA